MSEIFSASEFWILFGFFVFLAVKDKRTSRPTLSAQKLPRASHAQRL